MSDVFSLAPEGQAWTDDKTAANPARPEDYEPTFFQGSIAAPVRGVAEGTLGLAQSAVGFSKRLISDPAFTADVAPTVNIFRVMFPDADKALNDTYDTIGKQLQDARGYVKPDAGSQGTAAEVLYGLGQFVPAIGATIVGGPTVGAATAFSSTYEQSYQDFKGKGVDESTARNLATQQSLFNAAGMALPAAVGTTLATRIASGVAINIGFGGLNRYSVGETLEEKGYTEMAKQYRVFDGQAMLVDAVLGGAFGGAHHLAARNADAPPPADTEAPIPAAEVQSVQDSAPTSEATPEPVALGDGPAAPQATYETRMAELEADSGLLLSRGDRKVWQSEVANSERILKNLNEQRAAILEEKPFGSGKALATARQDKQSRIRAVDQQIDQVKQRLQDATDTLAPNMPGGRYYEARADLSRLNQGIIPESMRGLVRESVIKPSDIDAAHTLNEGLYYDLESSPVLHASNESINSHVAAMDEAYRQLNDGQPVNVGMMARGLDGPARPGMLESANEQYHAMQQVFEENGVRYETPSELAGEAPPPRTESAFTAVDETGGQVSVDPDTGQAISSNSYDLMAARDMATTNPDLTITHPDTGQPAKLSDVLAEFDEQIQTVQNESKVYSVAAACFLRNP
ncbi:hypothetical protein CI630_17710 [Enterobacter hormaechei subsp. steigerwaltii]|uniref:hypothetical protein n=1 Tax=Enterobacter cloacae complex TaxID=354276 RepID=UPI0007587674|nr:hypothetical protein [Enterobacter hormaechei]KVI93325.1 hypothetical protein AWS43_16440 [Enterobacter hormaechei subsp. steigerwaltii]MCW4757074.1 hypothetical protein [Enterobacter hormaechei subsp. xiangfangensis]MCW4796722.1 hypothetical protein [Enterobacter hormaechei subsp. xiangfangensis]MCW4970238.1 hypothetical protein [Enterobacter hormaechei subsp. xiangfangensis]MDF3644038.1 hypothetical protein [Enterobacter hormaechei]